MQTHGREDGMKIESKIKGVEIASEWKDGVAHWFQEIICATCDARLRIATALGRSASELTKITNEALALAERADTALAEVTKHQKALDDIRKAVGPRAK